MKCHDCGTLLTNENQSRSPLSRRDICDGCWGTRQKLVNGEIVLRGSQEFKEIQRRMANGRGTAKRYIDSLIALRRLVP